MALPIVPVVAVRGAEHGLLGDERMPANPVLHEARYRAQGFDQRMVVLRSGDAREDDDGRLERSVQAEHRLAAGVARGVGDDVPERAKHAPDGPAVSEPPPDHRLHRVQSELELGRDAEVASSSPERPQQLGVFVLARAREASVGRDQIRPDDVVARQTVLRRQVADAASEGEAAHTGRPDDAARRHEALRHRRAVEVEPRRATFRAGEPGVLVHVHAPHAREVDHEAAVENAVPRRVVASSAHGNLELVRAREVEGGRDVGASEATDDHRGPTVDERVEADARSVVLGVPWHQHVALERLAQLFHPRGDARLGLCHGTPFFASRRARRIAKLYRRSV